MGRGRVDFGRGIARLTSYARYHGHANPKANEVWLEWSVGLWVSSLRVKFRAGRLTEDQIAVAADIGVRFRPPYRNPKPTPKPLSRAERKESDYLKRLGWLEDYFHQHGNVNVPQLQGTESWPGAGRWIARLRGLKRQKELSDAVVLEAESMNICWNPGQGKRSW